MKHAAPVESLLDPAELRDLPASAKSALHAAARLLARGELAAAERELTFSLVYAPLHAAPHRLLGLTLHKLGRPTHAVASFRAALAARPGDAGILAGLAQAQADAGDLPGAIDCARLLVEQQADARAHALLATLLERHGEMQQALRSAEQALARDPHDSATRLRRGRCLFQTGQFDAAAVQFRELLRDRREVSAAWHGLGELRTVKFDAADRAELERLARNKADGVERAVYEHVLGRACEDAGDYACAYAAFVEAARMEHAKFRWDAAAFERYVESQRAAFAQPLAQDDSFGREVIFIIGMPRSGSTLLEQILAAHGQVEGASELPDLHAVIQQESERRCALLAQWAPRASPADWRRLGETYLARTQRWRTRKPRCTDKMPGNWVHAEPALAMLPGARIIDCRRDALETCWSCFKQFFAPGIVTWSYDFEDLAHYWHACTAHGDHLAARYPGRVRVFSLEALLADPEKQTRALLEFCGLEYDAACLRPHEVARTIRTASAAQVRQPLARRVPDAQRYGALLDPLRRALERTEPQH